MTTPAPAVQLVDTRAALDTLVNAIAHETVVGLDTESDGFFRYRPKLCLIQLRAGDVRALIDPLALPDLGPLLELLRRPAVETVLHDAEQDVMLLQRQYGVTLGRIFDTSYAARLAGMTQVGLQGVVQHFFGVTLDKKEQRSDWARRPLSPPQITYAALDVEHLGGLREALSTRLTELGRLHAASQAFDRIRARLSVDKVPDLEGWKGMKGVRALDPQQLGMLKALWEWRESLASARDLAPFRVLNPETLFELVRAAPKDVDAVGKVRGVPPSATRGEDGRALLAAVLQSPPFTGPLLPPRPPETDADRLETARFEALRAWRTHAAKGMGVEVGIVASNAALKLLARQCPASLEALTGLGELLPWQVEAFGAAIVDVLGKPVDPAPPRRHR